VSATDTAAPRLAVVFATYNRPDGARQVLADLAAQTLPPEDFEVAVVDDGSRVDVREALADVQPPFRLQLLRQDNAGQGAARHRGVLATTAPVVLFVDDDVRFGPDFLEGHVEAHAAGARLVQGEIASPPSLAGRPLFERFHQDQLERFAAAVESGRQPLRGTDVCTANVSVRREDYMAVGGFDTTLGRSEDRELGVRLELAGHRLAFSRKAKVVHHSDHDDVDMWMQRAFRYGLFDRRISRKHPQAADADPWRFFFLINPISRPLVLATVAAPALGARLSRLAMRASSAADRLGLGRLAVQGTTLTYGLEYFRGVREDAGSLREAIGELAAFAVKGRSMFPSEVLQKFWSDVVADYDAIIGYRNKYNADQLSRRQLPADVARKIGFQMMVAVRLMRALRDAHVPLGAQVVSRLIRHLYSAEIHWDAEVAPGVSIIHGVDLVLSHSCKVGEGCILFHEVTLGEGIDPVTREVGAPTLERNVHVGPGAKLVGPIVVGEGTKIGAGVVLTRSVPKHSRVLSPEPGFEGREAKPAPERRTSGEH
jgi:serine acetyltransferase/GT2 family glycosyltransferase